MNKAFIVVLSLALIINSMVIVVSCASDNKPIETDPDFIGFVTEIHPNQEKDVTGQISVESHADKIVTRYTITIKRETLIFQQDGDNIHKVAFAALETKQWVKIWFSGPVMESWPIQATAQQVMIVEYATLIN